MLVFDSQSESITRLIETSFNQAINTPVNLLINHPIDQSISGWLKQAHNQRSPLTLAFLITCVLIHLDDHDVMHGFSLSCKDVRRHVRCYVIKQTVSESRYHRYVHHSLGLVIRTIEQVTSLHPNDQSKTQSNMHKSCTTDLSSNRFITSMSMHQSFNQTIDQSIFPPNLLHLTLGADFSNGGQIVHCQSLPSTLISLRVENASIFQTLNHLIKQENDQTISQTIHQTMNRSVWPPLLDALHVSGFVNNLDCCQVGIFPPTLTELTFGCSVKQSNSQTTNQISNQSNKQSIYPDILIGVIPFNVTHLTLLIAYIHVDTINLLSSIPSSVTHLKLGIHCYQPIKHIVGLSNPSPISQSINLSTNPSIIPSSVRFLDLSLRWPRNSVMLDKSFIPPSVVRLTYSLMIIQSNSRSSNQRSNMLMDIIPESVTHLRFNPSFINSQSIIFTTNQPDNQPANQPLCIPASISYVTLPLGANIKLKLMNPTCQINYAS